MRTQEQEDAPSASNTLGRTQTASRSPGPHLPAPRPPNGNGSAGNARPFRLPVHRPPSGNDLGVPFVLRGPFLVRLLSLSLPLLLCHGRSFFVPPAAHSRMLKPRGGVGSLAKDEEQTASLRPVRFVATPLDTVAWHCRCRCRCVVCGRPGERRRSNRSGSAKQARRTVAAPSLPTHCPPNGNGRTGETRRLPPSMQLSAMLQQPSWLSSSLARGPPCRRSHPTATTASSVGPPWSGGGRCPGWRSLPAPPTRPSLG